MLRWYIKCVYGTLTGNILNCNAGKLLICNNTEWVQGITCFYVVKFYNNINGKDYWKICRLIK